MKKNELKHYFIVASSIFILLFLITEIVLRSFGLQPSVTDNANLWALRRSQISDSENQIVLLGNSRILAGFDLLGARHLLPEREFLQLGILGTSPIPILHDIAINSSFRGLAIVGLWEPDITSLQLDERNEDRFHANFYPPYLMHFYQGFSVDKAANRKISNILQSKFVTLHPFHNLRSNLVNLLMLRAPQEFYVHTDQYRSRDIDYSLIDIEHERNRRISLVKKLHNETSILPPKEWILRARLILSDVEKIQARGGRIVFVYFPISGESESWIRQLYPLDDYWNMLKDGLGLETLYFRDYPELIFECPDTSHLDKRDKPTFTSNLLNIINP